MTDAKTKQIVQAWSDETLRRIFQKIVGHFRAEILFGRWILKHQIYIQMNWWYKASKEETRRTMEVLVAAFPGVLFGNRGVFIPKGYLLMNANGSERPQ